MSFNKVYIVIGSTLIVVGISYIIFRKKINNYISKKFFNK